MRENLAVRATFPAASISPAVAFLTSEDASYVNGQTHLIDGGLTAAYYSPPESSSPAS